MTSWRVVRIFAGIVILLTLLLGAPGSPLFHSANWLWVTVFVGANLLQSGITRWCLLNNILQKLGLPASCATE